LPQVWQPAPARGPTSDLSAPDFGWRPPLSGVTKRPPIHSLIFFKYRAGDGKRRQSEAEEKEKTRKQPAAQRDFSGLPKRPGGNLGVLSGFFAGKGWPSFPFSMQNPGGQEPFTYTRRMATFARRATVGDEPMIAMPIDGPGPWWAGAAARNGRPSRGPVCPAGGSLGTTRPQRFRPFCFHEPRLGVNVCRSSISRFVGPSPRANCSRFMRQRSDSS